MIWYYNHLNYNYGNLKTKKKISKSPLENSFEKFKQSSLLNLDDSLNAIEVAFYNFLNSGILNDAILENIRSRKAYSFDSLDSALMHTRWTYVTEYGYTLLSHQFIHELSNSLKGKKVLEVGAGSGFLAYQLQKKGIDITPIDKSELKDSDYKFKREYTTVIKADAEKFLQEHGEEYDVVIMSWPNYSESFANTVVKNLSSKHTLYYCGEGSGGCTADDDFFDRVEYFFALDNEESDKLNNKFISWPGIHDRWQVFNLKT